MLITIGPSTKTLLLFILFLHFPIPNGNCRSYKNNIIIFMHDFLMTKQTCKLGYAVHNQVKGVPEGSIPVIADNSVFSNINALLRTIS